MSNLFQDVPAPSSWWSRTADRLSAFWEDKALDHYSLVGAFFLSHVVFVALDIITDILQAKDHFQRGHPRWGAATIGFIMVNLYNNQLRASYTQ